MPPTTGAEQVAGLRSFTPLYEKNISSQNIQGGGKKR